MDISEEYIEMCKKAFDIQKVWIPKAGDWFCNPLSSDGDKFKNLILINYEYYSKKKAKMKLIHSRKSQRKYPFNIWLPRQDQLQEMISSKFGLDTFNLHRQFSIYDQDILRTKSFEILWLRFAMASCFEKKWDSAERCWKEVERQPLS